jgi:tetratricopeptide (TPR) repeat protein
MGDTAGAIGMYREMTAVAERVAAADPLDRRAKYDLANCLLRLGSALTAGDGMDEGVAALERSAVLMGEIGQAEPKNNRPRLNLVFLYMRIGDAMAAMSRTRPSIENYQKAIDMGTAMVAAAPDEKSVLLSLSSAYNGQGLMLAAARDRAGAIKAGTQSTQVLEQWRKEQPGNVRNSIKLAEMYYGMAQIHRKLGDGAGPVCSWLEKAGATYPQGKQRESLTPADEAKYEAAKRELAACAGPPQR